MPNRVKFCRQCGTEVPEDDLFCVSYGRERGQKAGIPAPELIHAIAAAVREALHCREFGEETVILIALCGHGHLDLAAYEKYLAGEFVDYELTAEAIAEAITKVPVIA